MSEIKEKSHSSAEPIAKGSAEDDPYCYGWRYRYEPVPGGGERLRQVPLTYADLLSTQVGDFIVEDTVHRQVTEDLAAILRRRYAGELTVAVWSDLKIAFWIPGLTTGPGPDVCLVEGVEDRDRRRRSFRYGEEPGKVVLTVEVVSEQSTPKDYRDVVEIYCRLGVEEYLAVRPLGLYADGPFELRAWRRDPRSGRLGPIRADGEGRFRLRTAGILVGTGPEGVGLRVWDAETGELLRSPDEERALLERRAEQAEKRLEQAEDEVERLRFRLDELESGCGRIG